MKPLEKEFIGRGEVKGFKFTQIKATNMAYLYKVDSGWSINYEVFKRRENVRYGVVSYPTSKAFGVWAWTCMTLEGAEKKFNEINELKKGLMLCH